MSNTLQKRHAKLVEKVRKMRHHQARYFKYRAGTDLEAAKRYEREVDRLLEEEQALQVAAQGTQPPLIH